ncbi:MAG: hypothetical protein KC944_21815 [Candidatus Omnitrophica bacterium]|nr:hypothetical protein [Candidatus Omnitrophota bacterium]
MNRRERLMATLRGETVDRPPVSFYEINGYDEHPEDPDPFNIYSDPSWRPLIQLAAEKTDRILMRRLAFSDVLPDPLEELSKETVLEKDGSRFGVRSIQAGDRILTSRTRRDPDLDTVWTIEHLLKDTDDLRAFIQIPTLAIGGAPNISPVLETERAIGDSGIVMIDTPDPLCLAAMLFDMADYTVIASTENLLFRQLLDWFATVLIPRTEAVAKALPGRLWRIYGPEYASPPYLRPKLFREYVCEYVGPMVEIIHRYGGYARIHSHGNLKGILEDIISMNPDGLDPIEPPPQGDVELREVRDKYGKELVLFGNLEVSDIETLPTDLFAERVKRALEEGTAGEGRGFVLMPSAAPYGRKLSSLTLKNYEKMIELVESF